MAGDINCWHGVAERQAGGEPHFQYLSLLFIVKGEETGKVGVKAGMRVLYHLDCFLLSGRQQ